MVERWLSFTKTKAYFVVKENSAIKPDRVSIALFQNYSEKNHLFEITAKRAVFCARNQNLMGSKPFFNQVELCGSA